MKTIELNRKKLSNGLGIDNQEAIQIYQISDVVTWTELDLQPQEDMMLQLNDSQNAYLHFIYNFEGHIHLKSNHTSHGQALSSFQSAMVHDKSGHEVYIALKGGNHYHISIAQLVKFNTKKETNSLFLQFEKTFRSMSKNHFVIHTGLPNLEFGEYVKKIRTTPKERLPDKLLVTGYIHILLSKKLKQFLEHIADPMPNSQLTQKEIKRIQSISDEILQNPEMNYPIDELCTKHGLNASKLQQGFKEIHGKTVCNFINSLRLEKAAEMLTSSDLNVSEIVYSVGWTSRSYFCKIFKQRYKCSPKSYQTLCTNA